MNNIFLIGPMGSGKSAVGRRLARETGNAFVDSDDVIEESTGVDIPFIFDKEGEAGFRQSMNRRSAGILFLRPAAAPSRTRITGSIWRSGAR
jgi:shikimate kinase